MVRRRAVSRAAARDWQQRVEALPRWRSRLPVWCSTVGACRRGGWIHRGQPVAWITGVGPVHPVCTLPSAQVSARARWQDRQVALRRQERTRPGARRRTVLVERAAARWAAAHRRPSQAPPRVVAWGHWSRSLPDERMWPPGIETLCSCHHIPAQRCPRPADGGGLLMLRMVGAR